MPELLRIQTAHFELSIWSADVSKRQLALDTTLAKRNSHSTTNSSQPLGVLRFSPALEILEWTEAEQFKSTFPTPQDSIQLERPLFFENTQYQFEWVFLKPVDSAHLNHRSARLNNSFRFIKHRRTMPARLTGTITTGNDVGWMRLPLVYKCENTVYTSQFSFEVLPTKMDLHHDLPVMYQAIDTTLPLWRFSLVEKTEQDAAKGKQRGHFPLMWLANFNQLRQRFEKGLKIISQAPHSRLQSHTTYSKADRLKGRIPYNLGVKVKEDLANGQLNKRYAVENKRLSVDTPENQFIKMVVSRSKKQLADIEQKLRHSNDALENQRLSDVFFEELHAWQQPLKKILGRSFLKEVSSFSGLNRESLVLQQKTGYSAVYRVWQDLKFYLDVFANQSSISMKSVADVYEVWCFLTLKSILEDELGFIVTSTKLNNLRLNELFEYQMKDGFAGAFELKRADGVKARLAHEPRFTKTGTKIRSYLVPQEPDIVLEVILPSPTQKRFVWIFDAKYRIKTETSRLYEVDVDENHYDQIPDDAINQMHRYRDALIRLTKDGETDDNLRKSRPVFGAFALYPGYFDQENDTNPYAEAIKEIGIGAFALLPNTDESRNGHKWLSSFLKEQIGNDKLDILAERLYVQDAARIPYSGMRQVLYPDLTMTVALGGSKGKNQAYFDAFEDGTAKWYHLPKKTFLKRYKQHVVEEVRYLAIATTSKNNTSYKEIDKLWPVKSVTLLPRYAINEVQAGSNSSIEEHYYLFELGSPLTMQKSINRVPHRPIKNTIKLTTLRQVEKVERFSDVEAVYSEALVK